MHSILSKADFILTYIDLHYYNKRKIRISPLSLYRMKEVSILPSLKLIKNKFHILTTNIITIQPPNKLYSYFDTLIQFK